MTDTPRARPRKTTFWKGQQAKFDEVWYPFAQSAPGRQALIDAFCAYLPVSLAFLQSHKHDDPQTRSLEVQAGLEQLVASLDALETMMRRDAPPLAHAWGAHMHLNILRWFTVMSSDAPGDREAVDHALSPPVVAHFLPDNPLEGIDHDTLTNTRGATMQHFQQVRDYYRSLRPEGKRGRPPNVRTKTGGRRGLDPDKASRAAAMALDGVHWSRIHTEVIGAFDQYDKQARGAARARLRRLVERGHLDANRSKQARR